MRNMLAAALAFAGVAVSPAIAQDAPKFETGLIPSQHIMLPSGDVNGAVFLISDTAGWGAAEEKQAQDLLAKGVVVVGIDFPAYMAALRDYDLSQNDGCIYLVSDIESLSQQAQRAAGNSPYRPPIVAGIGEGGALALAIASQTPDATIGQTLAIDPTAGIPLTKQLCTPADKQTVGDHMIYGLSEGPLPDDVIASFTSAATKDGRDHVEALKKDHPDIDIRDEDDDAQTVMSDTLDDLISASSDQEQPLGLPLSILEAKPAFDTMAIVYSGDGGWRDIDKEVGSNLQKRGIPVVGVDSLRYFWSERKPQETADDLARIIETYRKHWKVKHVMLVGYSFGADVIPATYNLLKAKDKDTVIQLSLLAPSHEVDYVISVMGWLGAKTAGAGGNPVDDLKKVEPGLVQCLYGSDDDEEGSCKELKGLGMEVVVLPGDHHFDEDYDTVAQKIVDGLKSRVDG